MSSPRSTPTARRPPASSAHVLTSTTNKQAVLVWEPLSTPDPVQRLPQHDARHRISTGRPSSQRCPERHRVYRHGSRTPSRKLRPSSTPPAPLRTGTPRSRISTATNNPISGISINGLAYGFAYDDQGGQSTDFTVAPTTPITIDLLSWKLSDPIPAPPHPNPLPAPPTVPSSLALLAQPASIRLGAANTVSFKVFTAHGHTFYGGTTVRVQVIGPETATYDVIIDPMTGVGIALVQPHEERQIQTEADARGQHRVLQQRV